jgi:hypothetical protein
MIEGVDFSMIRAAESCIMVVYAGMGRVAITPWPFPGIWRISHSGIRSSSPNWSSDRACKFRKALPVCAGVEIKERPYGPVVLDVYTQNCCVGEEVQCGSWDHGACGRSSLEEKRLVRMLGWRSAKMSRTPREAYTERVRERVRIDTAERMAADMYQCSSAEEIEVLCNTTVLALLLTISTFCSNTSQCGNAHHDALPGYSTPDIDHKPRPWYLVSNIGTTRSANESLAKY